MKIVIYAKKRTTNDGKTFFVYLSKLTKKDGTETPVTIHFKRSCVLPNPDKTPCVIEFQKQDANLTTKTRHYAKTDVVTGEPVETEYADSQLWISAYTLCGDEYVDTSLDEYE